MRTYSENVIKFLFLQLFLDYSKTFNLLYTWIETSMSGLEIGRKKIIWFRQVLTSCTQLETKSFYDLDWTRTAAKCTKMKNTRAKLPFMLRDSAICDVIVVVVVVVVEVVVYTSLCLQHAFQHIHMKSIVCTSIKLIIFLQRYVRHTRFALGGIVRKDEFTLVMAN